MPFVERLAATIIDLMNPLRATLLLSVLAAPLAALDQLDLSTAGQWYAPLRERPSARLQSAFGWETPAHNRDADEQHFSRSGGAALVAGRVMHDATSEAWVRVAAIDIRQDSTVVLPQTGSLPERLQDVRIGGFWRTVSPAEPRRVLGVDVESSSPSDVPYSGKDVLAASATVFASLPAAGRDSWALGIRWDSNRSFLPNIPLPYVSYRWDHGPDWVAIVGLPFTTADIRLATGIRAGLTWAIFDTFIATTSWTPGHDGPAFLAPWTVQLGVSQTAENWLRADRPDTDLRLTYKTIRIYTAGEWSPFPGNRLRLAGGIIPRRSIQENDSSFSSENRIVLDGAWFTSLGLRLAY